MSKSPQPDWRDGLPWRANVGIFLVNSGGMVWVGKSSNSGPEIVEPGREWQMPQGGIDANEDIVTAGKRELFEETGAHSVRLIASSNCWWNYDFPIPSPDSDHKLAPFRGQKQRWLLFRFLGRDDEFDISAIHVDEPAEFTDWRWVDPADLPNLVVAFKREQYQRVVAWVSSVNESL